jgi:hypothetical protein
MVPFATVRQWMFPKEFRIAPPSWTTDPEELLTRLTAPRADSGTPARAALGDQELRLLADVGTGLWRLRQRMLKPGSTQPLDEMRRAYRHVESIWDALAQAGTEIQDHADAPFDAGMSLKVISIQPTPGLARERVIETIKPTIYYKGKHIQMGEVIVGRPETSKPDKAANQADLLIPDREEHTP